MGFSFKGKNNIKKEGDPSSKTEHSDYRDRAKADRMRYKLAVDTEFWLCFCFGNEDQRSAFSDLVQAGDNGFVYGDALDEVLEAKIGASPKRQFAPLHPRGAKVPDPLSGVVYSGDLEEDCFAEADALLRAFESQGSRKSYDNVFDSSFYVVAIFRDGGQVEKFLADYNLLKFGDKYIDGSAFLRSLSK